MQHMSKDGETMAEKDKKEDFQYIVRIASKDLMASFMSYSPV